MANKISMSHREMIQQLYAQGFTNREIALLSAGTSKPATGRHPSLVFCQMLNDRWQLQDWRSKDRHLGLSCRTKGPTQFDFGEHTVT